MENVIIGSGVAAERLRKKVVFDVLARQAWWMTSVGPELDVPSRLITR